MDLKLRRTLYKQVPSTAIEIAPSSCRKSDASNRTKTIAERDFRLRDRSTETRERKKPGVLLSRDLVSRRRRQASRRGYILAEEAAADERARRRGRNGGEAVEEEKRGTRREEGERQREGWREEKRRSRRMGLVAAGLDSFRPFLSREFVPERTLDFSERRAPPSGDLGRGPLVDADSRNEARGRINGLHSNSRPDPISRVVFGARDIDLGPPNYFQDGDRCGLAWLPSLAIFGPSSRTCLLCWQGCSRRDGCPADWSRSQWESKRFRTVFLDASLTGPSARRTLESPGLIVSRHRSDRCCINLDARRVWLTPRILN